MRIELIASGTHPFSAWEQQKITNKERYHRVVDRAQQFGQQLLIFGVHTHVGLEDRSKVLPIISGLLPYYPHVLALSASSPFYSGADTGYASVRTQIFQQIPTAGLPYQFEHWSELERYASDITKTGVIESFDEIRWDVRPALHYGTVESRIADSTSNLMELRAISALNHCLVEWLSQRIDGGEELVKLPQWFVEENKWRAARYGLEAMIITDADGTEELVVDSIEHLYEQLAPIAVQLNCVEDLAGIREILWAGASYQRQRDVAALARAEGATEHEALEAVVRHLMAEMSADRPLPAA